MIIKDFDLNDVFLFSEIMDKMDLDFDSRKLSRSVETAKLEGAEDAKKIGKEIVLTFGADLIVKIIKNLHKAKAPVQQFISNMTGLQLDAVGKMNMKDMKKFFTELIEHEGFGDFLSQAGNSEE